MSSRIEGNLQKHLITAASLACLGIVALSVVSYCGGKFVMDDALMFVRYANNWLATGTVAWNPGDPPTYGPTSLGYLSVVTLLSALMHAGPYTLVQIASLGLGVLFLGSLVLMVVRESGACSRPLMFLVVAACLANGATFLAAQFMTGMDTTLAMCSVSLLMLLWRAVPTRSSIMVGLVGGSLLLVRPDLVLISAGVPCLVWLTGEDNTRDYWRDVFLTTLATIGVLCVALTVLFGTPVPLSAYAKVFSPYGPDFRAIYRSMPIKQSINFIAAYWSLFALATGLMAIGGRSLLDKKHRLVLAIVIVVLGWFVYLLAVTQIMAYRGRFYHPILPCLVFLVLWGASQFAGTYERWLSESPRMILVPVVLLLVGSVVQEGVSVVYELRSHLRQGYVGKMSTVENYKAFWSDFWFQLPEVLAVSPDLSVATTEVGMPGIMHPNGSVIDLAGLNDAEIAMNGFRADLLLTGRKPDVIYMPHPHYVNLNRALTTSAEFENYDLYPKESLKAEMDVAIRKDSPFAASLYALMPDRPEGL
jgi:hypothetical protein